MAFKFVIFAAAMAVSSAKPFTIVGNNYYPNSFEAPKFATAFGHGFASDVLGVKYANSIGSSFSTGDAEAIGAGFASNDGTNTANGLGSAITRGNNIVYYPAQPSYRNPTYFNRNASPSNSVSYAQNIGGSGTAYALSQSSPDYRTAVSSPGYSFSQASNSGSNNIATAQALGGSGTSIANANNFRDQSISNAFTVGNGGYSGATSFNAPGQQIAQAYNFNQ